MTVPPSHSVAAGRVRLAAVIVVIVGWLAAAVVFALAPAAGELGADGYSLVAGHAYASGDASPREIQQIERLGGKAAVLTFKFNRWFKSLWSGRPLSYMLAALSVLVALGCLHLAGLIEETADPPS